MVEADRSCQTELSINPVAPQRESGITASLLNHTTVTLVLWMNTQLI